MPVRLNYSKEVNQSMRNARTRFFALLLSVCMLASLLAMPAGAAEFSDVPDWAAKSVDRWTEAGIMEGNKDGGFDAKHTLTRAEFAVILCKLMGYTEKSDPATFTDLPEDKEAADALLKLHAAGVMLGVGNDKADPNGTLTREHVAVMMFRALNMKSDPNAAPMSFTDAGRVSDWAKVEMTTMSSLKLIEGVGNNTLAPKRNIPKQDMAALLDKMIAAYVTENGKTVDTSNATNPNGAVIIKASNVTIKNAANAGSIVITADAPKNAAVTVAGTVKDITVAAAGAKVTVNKDAKVNSITVAEGADNATVTAMTGAKVDSVTTCAKNVKVNGAKDAIGSVTASAGSAEVKAAGAKVNVGDADVKVDGKSVQKDSVVVSNQTGSGTGSSGSIGGGYNPTPTPTPTPVPDPAITVLANGQTPSGKLAVGVKLTYSVNMDGSVVWIVGGFEVESKDYTVSVSDLGKTIYAKFTPTGKDPINSATLEVESSAPLDTDDEDAPVVLGDDVTLKKDDGTTATVSEDSKLVLSIEENTDVTETEIAAAKDEVQDEVQASVVAVAGAVSDDDVTLTDAQKAALAEATQVKAVDVDLALVTETTDEDGETTTETTPVHPVGTTTVKLSAAQLGMEGEDLNLYHFVASHTNKEGTAQTVTGTVDAEGKTVTFVTNGLSTIWVGNVPPRTVTFDTGAGGTEVASQKVKFGNRVNTRELPEKIERSGYIFCGWNYDLAVTPILEDMTITAVWVQGIQVPVNRINAALSAADSSIALTKEAGTVTVAANKDTETFTANLKVNLTVASLTGAVKYGISQDAQTAAGLVAAQLDDVSGDSVALNAVTVTDANGKVVAGKTSYYIKWVDGDGNVLALEEVVVVVDNGKGAADSKTVTRTVNRGLGRFEPYLTSSTKSDAPNWVGYINGNVQKSYEENAPKDYDLNFYVGFEQHFNGAWNEETNAWEECKYSPKDYDILNVEFTPFAGESFANKTVSAYFEYYTDVADSNGNYWAQIPCTPVSKDGKLIFTLDANTVNTPATNSYLSDLNLYLTVDGATSLINFWGIINPKYAGDINEEYENVWFNDMASLKTALGTAAADTTKRWGLNYNGAETAFTISESITIPANCEISFGRVNYNEGVETPVSIAVTVANGATVTVCSGEARSAYINIPYQGSFTVAQGGKVTAVTPGYDQYSSRTLAQISCSQITVQSGGAIDVSDNGLLMLRRSWEGSNNGSACTLEAGSQVTVSGILHVQNYAAVELGAQVDVGSTGQLYLHNDSNLISGTVSVNSVQWGNAQFYGTTTITSTGKVHASTTGENWGYAVEFNGPLNNRGAITVASGARVFVSNVGFAMQNSGTIELNGALRLNGTKLVNTGSITGSGTITGALGDDTTSYDERNGLTYVEVTGRQTFDNYSRYKFTFDPDETVEVTLYKSTLVNEQGGTSTITANTEDFPEN